MGKWNEGILSGYPKQFYKGFYTPEQIVAKEAVAKDESEEKALRKKGFIDGKEFFSKPAVVPQEDDEVTQ